MFSANDNNRAHVTDMGDALTEFSQQADARANRPEAEMAMHYLDAFGYFSRELAGWKDISLGDVVNAILSFQKFFNIKQTGQLDVSTIRAMESYRCGCPDIVQVDHPNGQVYLQMRALAQQNLPRWTKTAVKYCVVNYVNGLPQATQDAIIQQAFDQWSAVAGVTVVRAKPGEPCDILIDTGQGQRSNFDGPGGVLAWAYMPTGSDQQLTMKFDLDETWVTDATQRGVLMLNVACHEFGHLLGLDHSRAQSALMAPYYSPTVSKPQAVDDIPRVQARYGPPTTPPPTPPGPTPPTGSTHTLTIVGATSIALDGQRLV